MVQRLDPVMANVFTAHVAHADDPVLGCQELAAQLVHTDDPLTAANVPAAHAVHVETDPPSGYEYLPLSQRSHVVREVP